MHPRNPYRVSPDFASLAQTYPLLQKFLLTSSGTLHSNKKPETRTTINFKDEQALRCLTQAIMYRDFGITLEIPTDRLCPPVPNRMNYVLWIQDIVDAVKNHVDSERSLFHGIDIGTGSTAIYPVLACKLQETWRVIGTEIDHKSYNLAVQNVQRNGLDGRITIRKASKDAIIFFPLEDDAVMYDFTMCNPPFYSSVQEINDLSKGKHGAPRAVCTGAETEMIYADNGEVGFVSRMVEESVKFQGRCRWYTSMLGRMSSVAKIVELLRHKSVANYAITEFVQGQTRRWAIGWSFLDGRLPDSISRIPVHPPHILASIMPLRNTLQQPLPNAGSPDDILHSLKDVLKAIEGIHVSSPRSFYSPSTWTLRVEASENTWSRSARRKKRRVDDITQAQAPPIIATHHRTLILVCTVRIICSASDKADVQEGDQDWMDVDDLGLTDDVYRQEDKKQNESGAVRSLEFQWVRGMDRSLFESFVGHVGRKIIDHFAKK